MPVPIMVTAVGEASTGRYFLGQASCEWLPTPLLHSSLSPSVSLSFFFLSCFVFFYWPLLSNSFSFFFFSLFIFNLFCLFSEPFSSFLLTAPSNPHPQSHHLLLNHFSFGHFLEGDLTLTCWNINKLCLQNNLHEINIVDPFQTGWTKASVKQELLHSFIWLLFEDLFRDEVLCRYKNK